MAAPGRSDVFLFEDFRLDRHGLFRRDERDVFVVAKIGSRALDVLRMLVEQAGELVSKEEIVAAVWPGTVVEDSNLTVQISALRRVLDHGPAPESCIQTVTGRGYRFVAPVMHQEGADPTHLPNGANSVGNTSIASEGSGGGRSRRLWHFGLVGVAALAVIASVAVLGWHHLWFPGAGPPRLSIVVLPFANSNDAEQEYFADAVTDDLTTDLSRIADSFVIARTTAFTYKGKAADVKQIGRDLGVRYVLEGSVRRLGDQVQVNVQVLDGQSGAHIWADRFDTDRRDLAEAQNEITARLAKTLNVELIRDVGRRIEQEHTANLDASELVMRARALLIQPYSKSLHRQALDLLERALALNPTSIDAKILTANILVGDIADGFSSSVEQDQERAEPLIHEALDRDPNRSWAHAVLGLLRRVQGRWAEAQTEFETAIERDQNYAWAIRQLGQIVLIQGKPEAAIPYIERAIRLDPRSPGIFVAYNNLASCWLYLGRTDKAVDLNRKARALAPGVWYVHIGLAAALGLRGDIDEAKSEIAKAVWLKPDANSIARLRALAVTQGFGSPQLQALREKTSYAGLRRADFPEE
jgi:TolB-like protein/DNA-binding winged helix-turn-helix (wHTH) protein/Flp pilus assembly protein TadD